MTTQPDKQQTPSWQPNAEVAFAQLCESGGLNPIRLRRLIDRYIEIKQKPSRQELINALKHKPRIQVRATILSSVNKKLSVFLKTYVA